MEPDFLAHYRTYRRIDVTQAPIAYAYGSKLENYELLRWPGTIDIASPYLDGEI